MALIRAERSRCTFEKEEFHNSPISLSNEQVGPLSTVSSAITYRKTYRKPFQQTPKGCQVKLASPNPEMSWVLHLFSGTNLPLPSQYPCIPQPQPSPFQQTCQREEMLLITVLAKHFFHRF